MAPYLDLDFLLSMMEKQSLPFGGDGSGFGPSLLPDLNLPPAEAQSDFLKMNFMEEEAPRHVSGRSSF